MDKKLLHMARGHKRLFILSLIFNLFMAIAILGECYYAVRFVDGLFLQQQPWHTAVENLVFAFIALCIRSILAFGERWSVDRFAFLCQQDWRLALEKHLVSLSPLQVESMDTTQLLHLFKEGVESTYTWYANYLPHLIKAISVPIVFLFFIFPTDVQVSVLLLATIPLIPFFMMLIGSWTRRQSEKRWERLSLLKGYLEDALLGIETLKLLGREKNVSNLIEERSEQFRILTLSVQRWAFISALALELIATLSIALVAVSLGIRLVQGNIEYSTALFLLLIAPEYYQPMRSLGGYFHAGLDAKAAAKDFIAFLNIESQEEKAGEIEFSAFESIVFDQVSFAYHGHDRPVLQDVSFTLKKGEKVALVGKTGSGKSTLLSLMMGFLRPISGEVRLNGVPLGSVSKHTRHNLFALLPQTPYLLEGTVEDNIYGWGREENHHSSIQQIETLRFSHKLQDEVGNDGDRLSGGEKEWVVLMRLFNRSQPVLILDEATANMDLETEQMALNIIQQVMESDRTVCMIAHRIASLRMVDRVICLADGKIQYDGDAKHFIKEEFYA